MSASTQSQKSFSIFLSPLPGLCLELRDPWNYCGMPHAAPGNRELMAVFVYIQQVHAHRLEMTKLKGMTRVSLKLKRLRLKRSHHLKTVESFIQTLRK